MKRNSALFIGLDVGTTVLKAAVFEQATAAPLASRSFRLEIDLGPGGRREQDPSALGARTKEAFTGLRKDLGSDWSRVGGLGLARLAMLLRTAPQLISDRTLYVGAGEFRYFHLTESWRQDGCHAHQTGCYDARRDALTERLLKEIGVPVSFVAPLRKGHATQPLSEKAALETGLSPGIPVSGPYNDHEAGYLSSTGLSPKPLECSLGTAWVGSFIVPRDRGYGSPFHLPVPAPVGQGLLSIWGLGS